MAIPAGTRLTAERLRREFPIYAVCTADTIVNNSTTRVAITGLTVELEGNTTYGFRGFIFYQSNPDADIRFGWYEVPSGSTGWWTARAPDFFQAPVVGAERINYIETSVHPLNTTSFLRGAGDDTDVGDIHMSAIPSGVITTLAAGDLTFGFSQDTARSSNTIVISGSWLEFFRLS